MPRGVEVGPHPWDCLRGILWIRENARLEEPDDPLEWDIGNRAQREARVASLISILPL